MIKTMSFIALVLVAGFATVKLIDIETEVRRESLSESFARDRKMQEKTLNYFAFKHTFESTLEQLRKGEISLTDACDRVNRVATEFNPAFYEYMTYVEVGVSKEEHLARNLVGHVRSVVDMFPTPPSRLSALDAELNNLLRTRSAESH